MKPLRHPMYAIVDVETTGGYASRHRITEIAVVLHNGLEVEQRWSSLVNPGRDIPLHITALTGIDPNLVAEAPTFDQVADVVEELTKDRIFVGHNVNFDFSFVREAMKTAGHDFKRKKLCTVRLSRKLIPGLESYSLGRICDSIGIPFTDRHRAGPDADATAQLFAQLLQLDDAGIIDSAIKHHSREATLPPHLDRQQFDALPETPGVYYFVDAKGRVIYVGKAKKLKTRVAQHFTGSQTRNWQKQGMMRQLHSIRFEETGNELTALILEAHQIKRYWPRYNQAQKHQGNKLGLVQYIDRSGYHRLGIQRLQRFQEGIVRFHSLIEGRNFVWRMNEAHNLCPRLSGLATGSGACFETETGKCDGACCGSISPAIYNKRVHQALAAVTEQTPSFAIIGKGRVRGEQSVVLIENGQYQGFGFATRNELEPNMDSVRAAITPQKELREVRSIIDGHLLRNKTDLVWAL